MAVQLIRLLILYLLILVCMRLMGRRQIGELQTSELVITILLSEIAAIPLENNDTPILNSIMAVFMLTALEILLSAICVKSEKFRKLSQGNPITVIRAGTLDQGALKKTRITLDDLMEAMREKDVFDLTQVQYAILESNGKISLQLKPPKRNVTAEMLEISEPDSGMVCPVIYDGKIQYENFSLCGMDKQKLNSIVRQSGIPITEILLLTADKKGVVTCIRKEEKP